MASGVNLTRQQIVQVFSMFTIDPFHYMGIKVHYRMYPFRRQFCLNIIQLAWNGIQYQLGSHNDNVLLYFVTIRRVYYKLTVFYSCHGGQSLHQESIHNNFLAMYEIYIQVYIRIFPTFSYIITHPSNRFLFISFYSTSQQPIYLILIFRKTSFPLLILSTAKP